MDAVVDRDALKIANKAANKARRRQILGRVLMLAGVVIVAIGGVTFWLTGGRYVSTDDAYVEANKLMVSTDVSGLVQDVDVKEGQFVHKGDVLYDLGSGDGRIVVTAAKDYGIRAVGIDINPERIKEANENAKQAGVTNLVTFRNEDLFEADIKEASVVTLYLLTSLNLKLRPKLWKDLKPGTRIVSQTFDMGDWKPEKEESIDGRRIYLWRVPEPGQQNK
jgi:2-polyprenyl-3-methyl-5-hydroxy-6-metoxy-1,4-benzoquinol methylase